MFEEVKYPGASHVVIFARYSYTPVREFQAYGKGIRGIFKLRCTFSDFFLIIPVVVVEACLLKDNTQNFELFGCLGMLKHHYEIL